MKTDSIVDDQVAALTLAGTLPWMFGVGSWPSIGSTRFPAYGLRRPWIIIAQLGMIITIAAFLTLEDPLADGNLEAGLSTIVCFFFLIHNIFATLQDVSSDALAVDLIPDEDLARANGFMFASKGFGFMLPLLSLAASYPAQGFRQH